MPLRVRDPVSPLKIPRCFRLPVGSSDASSIGSPHGLSPSGYKIYNSRLTDSLRSGLDYLASLEPGHKIRPCWTHMSLSRSQLRLSRREISKNNVTTDSCGYRLKVGCRVLNFLLYRWKKARAARNVPQRWLLLAAVLASISPQWMRHHDTGKTAALQLRRGFKGGIDQPPMDRSTRKLTSSTVAPNNQHFGCNRDHSQRRKVGILGSI